MQSKPIKKVPIKPKLSIRDQLNKEQDPQKFAKLELERLKGEDPS